MGLNRVEYGVRLHFAAERLQDSGSTSDSGSEYTAHLGVGHHHPTAPDNVVLERVILAFGRRVCVEDGRSAASWPPMPPSRIYGVINDVMLHQTIGIYVEVMYSRDDALSR